MNSARAARLLHEHIGLRGRANNELLLRANLAEILGSDAARQNAAISNLLFYVHPRERLLPYSDIIAEGLRGASRSAARDRLLGLAELRPSDRKELIASSSQLAAKAWAGDEPSSSRLLQLFKEAVAKSEDEDDSLRAG